METKIVEQQKEQVTPSVKVIQVTADPVVTTYTEAQVDQFIQQVKNMIAIQQKQLDKWTALKEQFNA